MSSISMHMPAGSSATPTAERACFPASPSTSTSRSEHPFSTAGWSPKPGADADQAEHLHDPGDPVERPQLRAQCRQQPEAGEPGRLPAPLDVDVGAELPVHSGPVGEQRPVAREEEELPDAHRRHVVRDGTGR